MRTLMQQNIPVKYIKFFFILPQHLQKSSVITTTISLIVISQSCSPLLKEKPEKFLISDVLIALKT